MSIIYADGPWSMVFQLCNDAKQRMFSRNHTSWEIQDGCLEMPSTTSSSTKNQSHRCTTALWGEWPWQKTGNHQERLEPLTSRDLGQQHKRGTKHPTRATPTTQLREKSHSGEGHSPSKFDADVRGPGSLSESHNPHRPAAFGKGPHLISQQAPEHGSQEPTQELSCRWAPLAQHL